MIFKGWTSFNFTSRNFKRNFKMADGTYISVTSRWPMVPIKLCNFKMADGTYKALSDHGWIRYQCLYFQKRIFFNCDLWFICYKVACSFFTAKNYRIMRKKHSYLKKRKYLPHYWSEKGSKDKDTVVNRALPSLYRGGPEITPTVS